MKRCYFFFFLFLLGSPCIAQKLTLNDLAGLCSKKNWEDVNQSLLARNWTYSDSKKGDAENYHVITWSYNKDYATEKAQGWFKIYTYEGFPNKVSYEVFNKASYAIIQNSIAAAGFKLVDSEIEDERVTSVYDNASYSLRVSSRKGVDEEEDRSYTGYVFNLTKKGSVYDPNNGKKSVYYDDGTLKEEYSMLNGQMHGKFVSYYENGNVKTSSTFINGEQTGLFYQYEESGQLLSEISLKNGRMHGLLNIYESGKLSTSTTYADDVKNGPFAEFFHDEETGALRLKYTGTYAAGEKTGLWKLTYLGDDSARTLKYESYINGLKDGAFQDTKGDSLILGSFRQGQLQGGYKIYVDVVRMIAGGVINTNVPELTIITDGSYRNGKEEGHWRYYDLSKTLRSEGRFAIGDKIGEWKYYYTNWLDTGSKTLPYAKKLYLIESYKDGELEGKSTRFSYLNETKYPCSENDPTKNDLDSCTRYDYEKVTETSFYQSGLLNGPFEQRDSTNLVKVKGFFKNGEKDGIWTYRYAEKEEHGTTYIVQHQGTYLGGKEEGKWIETNDQWENTTIRNYSGGELHGDYYVYRSPGKISEHRKYHQGTFLEVSMYDSLGKSALNKYELTLDEPESYRCRHTTFTPTGYQAQEYFVVKEKEIDPEWFEAMFLVATFEQRAEEVKGFKDGPYTRYNTLGVLLESGEYKEGKKAGLWMALYTEKAVKVDAVYEDGNLTEEIYTKLDSKLYSGEFVYIDEKAKIKEVRRIKNGLRDGKTTYYDIGTDKAVKKESYNKGKLE